MQIIHTITQQQELFCAWVSTPLRNIAKHCADVWSREGTSTEQLTAALEDSMKQIPQYALCYLISPSGTVLTPTISHDLSDPLDIGNDVSSRPYFLEWDHSSDFILSRPYTSTKTGYSCMTAMQAVELNGEPFAIIAIDFDGSSSPHRTFHVKDYIQIKGDPSIRQQLFSQTRAITPMEEQIDDVHEAAEALLLHHGAFFVQLRYSRSTATARFTDRPYHDSIFSLEQLIASNTPNRQPLSSMSTISIDEIEPILDLFRELRLADDNIYLRSGSINMISGIVELNFSCDGSHHIPASEFLEKSTSYWLTGQCTSKSSPTASNKPEPQLTFPTSVVEQHAVEA